MGHVDSFSKTQREAFSNIIGTIGYVEPRIIYGMPSEGVNLNILTALIHIEAVDCILVNPHPGYFDYMSDGYRILLATIAEAAKQIITIQLETPALNKRDELLGDAIELMAKNSDAIFLIYDRKTKTKRLDALESKLTKWENKVIVCDYGA